MNIYFKISHWFVFLLFIFLAISGILQMTIFHYDTIIPNLEFAYGVNEIQSGRASQVFIAKVFRGELWRLHFYTGLIFSFLLFINIFHALMRINKIKHNFFIFLMMFAGSVLLITGITRYFRNHLAFMSESDKFWRHLMQDIHHYAAWFFGFIVICHIIQVIWLENKKFKGIISNMFTKNNFILKSILIALLVSSTQIIVFAKDSIDSKTVVIAKRIKVKDKEYVEAMKYYSGEKGFTYQERSFPNCPYDACTKDSRAIKSYMKNGRTYYTIKIHNFKKAKEYFEKSVKKYKNPLSAEKILIMILERINYKDKILDDYLFKTIKKELGLNSLVEIRDTIYKNALLIGKKNSTKIIYKVAEIFENGYAGIPKNTLKAKELYKLVLEKGNKNSMYYILAQQKVKK